jgi:hypothetical protein
MTIKACQELSTIQGHFYNKHISRHVTMSFFSCVLFAALRPERPALRPWLSLFRAIRDYSLLKSVKSLFALG